jgi:AcrR family transcriptional regulator
MYTKGELTKQNIVKAVNQLFNEKEMLPAWDDLASELKIHRSRITNYFPKKELLLLAIYLEFEENLKVLIEKQGYTEQIENFSALKDYYSAIMDLLFDYRFAISYVLVNPNNDEDLNNHINTTYKNNKLRLYQRVEHLVNAGLVRKKLLDEDQFKPFAFQHTNILTTWIISYKLYDRHLEFSEVKPTYLKGVLLCYFPFLSEKGKKEISNL